MRNAYWSLILVGALLFGCSGEGDNPLGAESDEQTERQASEKIIATNQYRFASTSPFVGKVEVKKLGKKASAERVFYSPSRVLRQDNIGKDSLKLLKGYSLKRKLSKVKPAFSYLSNRPPIITSPTHGARGDNVGDVVSLQVVASDPDYDPLSYSAINLPPGVSINSTTGFISGVVSNFVAGESPYRTSIMVSDGQLASHLLITWTVIPTLLPPPVIEAGITTFLNNTTYPLVSLRVDGAEQLTADLPPGTSIQITQSVGTHSVMTTAYSPGYTNAELLDVTVYEWNFTYQAGNTVHLTSPSIFDVMADYGASATWIGYYNVNIPMTFVFHSNGNFEVYDDGNFLASGYYAEQGVDTFNIARNFHIYPTSVSDPGNDGSVSEIYQYFFIDIGPNNQIVQFFLH